MYKVVYCVKHYGEKLDRNYDSQGAFSARNIQSLSLKICHMHLEQHVEAKDYAVEKTDFTICSLILISRSIWIEFISYGASFC